MADDNTQYGHFEHLADASLTIRYVAPSGEVADAMFHIGLARNVFDNSIYVVHRDENFVPINRFRSGAKLPPPERIVGLLATTVAGSEPNNLDDFVRMNNEPITELRRKIHSGLRKRNGSEE